MFEQSNNTFVAQYGRVQLTEVTHTYPISDWDKIYKSKTKKGYKDVTHLFKEIIAEKTAEAASAGETVTQVEIQNRAVKALFDRLMAYAKKTVAENYTVTQESVTQAMVDEAQLHINELNKMLGSKSSIEELNKKLIELYTTIPRQMSNVRDHLIKSYTSKSDIEHVDRMMKKEQDLLDTMAGQVQLIRQQKDAAKNAPKNVETKQTVDMLSAMGLTVDEVNADEIKIIKNMMGPNANQFRQAFRVSNATSQKRFDEQIANAKNKKTELFWHGSRNENWFNILQTGLLIRPSCAVHAGSMFSDGIYFADKAKKSIGYSSLRGSYWSGGSSNEGYLALFEAHIGSQRHIYKHDTSCYSITHENLKKQGFDSVFAHGGADLVNNEYIVYKPEQCTVKYIIEISN
jgi:poly [ADP-ribose] polymerase